MREDIVKTAQCSLMRRKIVIIDLPGTWLSEVLALFQSP
jgi:hypothetical protein